MTDLFPISNIIRLAIAATLFTFGIWIMVRGLWRLSRASKPYIMKQLIFMLPAATLLLFALQLFINATTTVTDSTWHQTLSFIIVIGFIGSLLEGLLVLLRRKN